MRMQVSFPDGTTVGPDEVGSLLITVGVFLSTYYLLSVLLG
jgi:hypothetical protein